MNSLGVRLLVMVLVVLVVYALCHELVLTNDEMPIASTPADVVLRAVLHLDSSCNHKGGQSLEEAE